jgi:hypothetical protein
MKIQFESQEIDAITRRGSNVFTIGINEKEKAHGSAIYYPFATAGINQEGDFCSLR